MSILKIDSLCFKWKSRFIINNFFMNLLPKQMILVQGASGSGKSTLINLIGGYLKPTAGSIELFQKNIFKVSEYELIRIRRKIGMITQASNLLKDMSVIENVMMPMLLDSKSEREARECAKEMLSRVGLLHKKNSSVLELSGGEEQRVCIARALVNQPEIILADEPTSSLDLINAENILSLCIEIVKEREVAMLWTSHNPLHINLFDKHIVMKSE